MTTRSLAIASSSSGITRERTHAANAMARLAAVPRNKRIRRAGHGTQRAISIYWRRARRHLRNAARAEVLLAALEEGAS